MNTGSQLSIDYHRSEPGSPIVFKTPSLPQAREEGGKENSERLAENSPVFKRPSSLCVRTPVGIVCEKCDNVTPGQDTHGDDDLDPRLQGEQVQGTGQKQTKQVLKSNAPTLAIPGQWRTARCPPDVSTAWPSTAPGQRSVSCTRSGSGDLGTRVSQLFPR